jgi:hypothetical protein
MSDSRDDKRHEAIARRFHEVYEKLAPLYEWETQVGSRVSWDALPATQKGLMIETVKIVLAEFNQSAGLRSAESYECQIKAQHQVIAERDATIASLRSHEQPIDIEERIRWHKSEARRLTLESIRGGNGSERTDSSDRGVKP